MVHGSGFTHDERMTGRSKPIPQTLRQLRSDYSKKNSAGSGVFNHERPHEGLNNETPGSLYQPSTKMFPRVVAEYGYPIGFVTRRVNNGGDISWHKGRVLISEVFRFEELGLEEVEESFYKVFFREVEIGEFDVEALRFRPVQIPSMTNKAASH